MHNGKPGGGVQTAPLMRKVIGCKACADQHPGRPDPKGFSGPCEKEGDPVAAALHREAPLLPAAPTLVSGLLAIRGGAWARKAMFLAPSASIPTFSGRCPALSVFDCEGE